MSDIPTLLRPYYIDDEHVIYVEPDDDDHPPHRERYVAHLDDGWTLAEAVEIALHDIGQTCDCADCAP